MFHYLMGLSEVQAPQANLTYSCNPADGGGGSNLTYPNLTWLSAAAAA